MSLRTVLAAAALVADGRVLLAHRHPHRQWYPDCWDLVGGHVEAGESPQQAIVRECQEELGIRIEDPRPFSLAVSDTALEMHAFVVTRWVGTPRNAEPDEHDDLGWFTAQELADLKLADAGGLPDIVAAIEFARAG